MLLCCGAPCIHITAVWPYRLKALAFLHMQVAGGRVLDEVEVDAELQKRRAAQAGYLDSSFPTIAGENQHSAAARRSVLCWHWVHVWELPWPHGVAVVRGHLLSVRMLHAGSGPNGAIIHYRAEQSSCRKVGAGTLLHILDAVLFDS